MSASSEQRRDLILAQVYEKGKVAMKNLASMLSVSEATVRRDLKSLAAEGRLELTYGGAVLPRISDFSFHSKEMRNVDAKRLIGRLAADLVGSHDQIFVDSGTTCFQMVPHLKRKQDLSIVTNSTRLAMELDAPGLSVITLGGQYRPDRMDTIGPLATRSLEGLQGFRAFIGADGLSMEIGPTAGDIESAHLYKLAVANARETVLLADHTKFLSPSLCKIVDFDSITRVVTDKKPRMEWMDFLEKKGIDVLCSEGSDEKGILV